MSPAARWLIFSSALASLAGAGILHWQGRRIVEEVRPPIPGLPINLQRGITKTPEFMVAREGHYSITLYLDRDITNWKMDCLLGVSMESRDCLGITSPVLLSWSLFADGTTTQQGQSPSHGSGSWSARRVGNTFGDFFATPGRKYVLQIESLRDASVLASAKPEIAVGRSARESKGQFATASLYSIGSIATAALAVILFLTSAVAYFFSRRGAT